MTTHAHNAPSPERIDPRAAGRLQKMLFLGGLLCLLAALAWGLGFDRQQFAHSWLLALSYSFTICAGCLFWILLHHAVDANWSVVVRRLFEHAASLAPWIALLALPLVACLPDLYRWWTPAPAHWGAPIESHDHLLAHKAPFLNKAFFLGRAAFYFLFFTFASRLLRAKSLRQDDTGDPRLSLSMRHWANALMIFFAASISFFGIDFLMSLDHSWFSTMWGVYIFAGSAASAMALIILLTFLLRRAGRMTGILTVEHNHIMGKLLFAFTVFWAYIGFSQYMLIYYGNIPEETWFYIRRNTGTWFHFSIFLAIGHFAVPFVLLMTQPGKRNGRRLLFCAGWLLFMHAVDLFWIIMPALQVTRDIAAGGPGHTTGFAFHPLDILSLAGFLGVLGALFLRDLARHSLFPCRDPRLDESIALTN